jgi:hypothetical protein
MNTSADEYGTTFRKKPTKSELPGNTSDMANVVEEPVFCIKRK